MRRWIWIVPFLMLAACSRTKTPVAASAVGQNPEPVASAPAQEPPVTAEVPPPDNPAPTATVPVPQPCPSPQPCSSTPQYAGRQQYAERQSIPAQPQYPPPQSVIPRGTHLRVRVDEELDTRHNRPGDRFTATLSEPVVMNGAALLPVGTRFHGHLVASKPSGRLKGRAVIGLTLDSFEIHGRRYPVDTSGDYRVSGRHRGRNFAFIGGGSGGGAAIGALAGGGTGAAIGALAGGGAGLAGAVITGRKQVAVPAESAMTFTLRASVTM